MSRDTEPDALKPILAAVDHLQGVVDENDRTIKSALLSLKTLIVQHYHATQSRLDDHARQLRRLNDMHALPPLEPDDAPRALIDDAAE